MLPIIILVACGLWGWAVGTGRGGVRLSVFVAGLGLVLDLAATIGWLSADIGIVGVFIAAIAGGRWRFKAATTTGIGPGAVDKHRTAARDSRD